MSEFLLPRTPAAQGLPLTFSRFFCHPQDIGLLSPAAAVYPLIVHSAIHSLGTTRLEEGAGAGLGERPIF